MPFFRLDTNVSKDKVTPEFLKSTSKLIANTLGKPESVSNFQVCCSLTFHWLKTKCNWLIYFQYVGVQVNAEQAIVWGGTEAPAGYAALMSIGQLGIEPNKKHAAAIYDHVNKHLGIPKDR